MLALTLCNSPDCSPPGFSVHGTFQARILLWVATSYSRGSSDPGNKPTSPVSPALAGRFLTTVPPGKPPRSIFYLNSIKHIAYIHCMLWKCSVQLLSHIRLFVTPWTAACQGFPAHHQLQELTQTHIHRIGDSNLPSHPLSSPSPPTFNLCQHLGLFR